MSEVIWAKLAYKDLDSIYEFIAKDSEIYAKRFVERLILSVSDLDKFPDSGRIVPEFNDKTIREIIVGNYRIVYKVKKDIISIARVHHAAQLLKK
jgi:toxin ParE1/3/4